MEYTQIDLITIERAAKKLKTVAHPVRLRLIDALKDTEHSVSDLTRLLNSEQAVISKHLSHLKKAEIVDCHKDCNFRYYFLKQKNILNILDCIRKSYEKEG